MPCWLRKLVNVYNWFVFLKIRSKSVQGQTGASKDGSIRLTVNLAAKCSQHLLLFCLPQASMRGLLLRNSKSTREIYALQCKQTPTGNVFCASVRAAKIAESHVDVVIHPCPARSLGFNIVRSNRAKAPFLNWDPILDDQWFLDLTVPQRSVAAFSRSDRIPVQNRVLFSLRPDDILCAFSRLLIPVLALLCSTIPTVLFSIFSTHIPQLPSLPTI